MFFADFDIYIYIGFSLCQSCESIVFLSVDTGVAYLGDRMVVVNFGSD